MLDGLIALVILISGFVILGSIFVNEPIFKPSYNVGNDILLALSSTNISNLNLERHQGIKQLYLDGKIPNNESSILQQAGLFFYDFCEQNNPLALKDANITIFEIINKIIPHPYYVELNFTKEGGCTLKHDRIYTSYIPYSSEDKLSINIDQTNAKVLIATEKVVFGNYDESTIFGPYIVRLTIWR